MRVYGALMRSLGNVLWLPECLRVKASSFWDQLFEDSVFTALFEKEREDPLHDLHSAEAGDYQQGQRAVQAGSAGTNERVHHDVPARPDADVREGQEKGGVA